jgi:hypothetical protein
MVRRPAIRLTPLVAIVILAIASGPVLEAGQARRGGRAATPAPAAVPATKTEAPQVQCPSPLGTGARTRQFYCDVLTGRDPADGIQITIPPHTGAATLTFDLHNRHLYSEELIQSKRGYRHYTATIGALTPDNTLLSRAVVQNEFRSAMDLVERIVGDSSPTAVKAVAPTGTESIRITIPADVLMVSILGEKLSVIRPDAEAPDTFVAPGRPIAVISNVTIEYRPAPVRRPAPRRR